MLLGLAGGCVELLAQREGLAHRHVARLEHATEGGELTGGLGHLRLGEPELLLGRLECVVDGDEDPAGGGVELLDGEDVGGIDRIAVLVEDAVGVLEASTCSADHEGGGDEQQDAHQHDPAPGQVVVLGDVAVTVGGRDCGTFEVVVAQLRQDALTVDGLQLGVRERLVLGVVPVRAILGGHGQQDVGAAEPGLLRRLGGPLGPGEIVERRHVHDEELQAGAFEEPVESSTDLGLVAAEHVRVVGDLPGDVDRGFGLRRSGSEGECAEDQEEGGHAGTGLGQHMAILAHGWGRDNRIGAAPSSLSPPRGSRS